MSQVTEQSVRFQTALASIKLIQASAVLDLTEDDFDFLTSNKVWIATDRSRARRCVEACVYGTLDFVGYPRFPAPVEFIAAVIAFDLSLRSSRSSYFATFRHQLTILSKTDALDEEKWLNMLGTFVKDWFRYESHFVHGRDSLVDILKERGLLSESDAVQPLIGKKS